MNIETLDLLVSVIGILMLLAFWHRLWRPLVVAHLRQDLFDARDFLFDLVADEQTTLRFSSEVYRGTREDLNMMIRFSHRVSLFSAVLLALMAPRRRHEYGKKVARLREGLSEEELRVIHLVDLRQDRALLKFLLWSSPLFWLSLIVLSPYVLTTVAASIFQEGVQVCCALVRQKLFEPAIEHVEYQSGQKYLFGFTPHPAR